MARRPEPDEDYFADTRMSFGEHIEDLRTHIIRGFYGFFIGMVLAGFLAKPALDFINAPIERAMQAFYDERASQLQAEEQKKQAEVVARERKVQLFEIPAKELYAAFVKIFPDLKNQKPPAEDAPPVVLPLAVNPNQLAIDLRSIMQKLGKRPGLSSLSPIESFMVFLKVWVALGLVISSPWLFYQIWLFVAAGLYPHERRYVTGYLPMSILLFLGGVALCQFLVIPTAIGALLEFNKWINIEPDFRLSEWLSFAILLPIVTGLCFETPLAMLLMARIGFVNSKQYLAYWRVAVFIMLIVAAVFSPTVDPLSLFLLWIPMVGLYFLGIWLVKRGEEPEEPESWEEEVEWRPEATKK